MARTTRAAMRIDAAPAELRIGLSGWSYPRWRGVFYPSGLAQHDELGYVSARFPTVEVNASFYRLQRPTTYRRWAQAVPEGFVFAVKGSRYIAHLTRLHSRPAMANFLASGVLALGDKLGPLLWQLPARTRYDRAELESFLGLLPRSTLEAARLATEQDRLPADQVWLDPGPDRPLRHALEVRHESFRDPDAYGLLAEHDVALVVADSAGEFPRFDEDTASFRYVRLHGDTELYTSGYSDVALGSWVRRIADWRASGRDVYVYFDNDAKVRAPVDAARLQQLCAETEQPG